MAWVMVHHIPELEADQKAKPIKVKTRLWYYNKDIGITKIEHFMEKCSEISVIAKEIGHPARVAIIYLLLKVNAFIGYDILEKIPLTQPTISQHLKVLKDANLI